MGWYLVNEDEQIPLGRGRVVGRDDFNDAPVLSRQHLRFAVTKGKLTVRDLDSRNGTWLNGASVTSDRAHPLAAGDVLRVNDYEFRVVWVRPHLAIGAAAVGLVLLMKVLDPSAAMGRAIGLYGWIGFALSAVVAAVVVSFAARWIPVARGRSHLAAIFLGTGTLDILLLLFVSRYTTLTDHIGRARVEYHCATHFKARECVRQVMTCPRCATRIEKWRRENIADRIQAAEHEMSTHRRLASPER